MAILNPQHLLDQARQLAPYDRGAARQVDLRRAISAAYYAVFHAVLTAGANQLVGAIHRGRPEYAAVYRGLAHRTLKTVCVAGRKVVLPKEYGQLIPSLSFSADLRTFCSTTADLQERRHEADYDPLPSFNRSDATAAISLAEQAINLLPQIDAEERRLFIFALWFGLR